MSEQTTCERHSLHWLTSSEGKCDWVVYRSRNNVAFPGEPEFTTHVETATADKPLYCIGCGCQLNADGTTTRMIPAAAVDPETNALIEDALAQHAEFGDNLRKLTDVAVSSGADNVEVGVDGLCRMADSWQQLVADCKRLYEERNAALQQPAAAEWLAERVRGGCADCEFRSECGSEYDEDGDFLGCWHRTVSEEDCRRKLLISALSATRDAS